MDAVAEVKSRLSIEDVVSEYIKLKRTGRNYKGLSPFTNEKTPSFIVSPEKQIWHDFSSGRGGDMFTFIQETEGLDFKGALELLARKAGVDLDQFNTGSSRGPRTDKQRLQAAVSLAVKFYQKQLVGNPKALEYIRKKRKFSKQTMLDFMLGYSPEKGNMLTDFLLKKGFKHKELELAGLSVRRGSRRVDMFRGRIMVPLCDTVGNPIGFTARLLADNDNAPKYINTPSTPLYDKSRHLYGLHLAKQAIREKDYSVVAEGNLDVIASHQAGFKQVVASAGTAMTEYQLKTLSRFSPNVRLAFDQDRAGLEAAERAIPVASKAAVDLSIISIPEGKDPDELIKKDPKLWEKAISDAQYAVDWLIDTYKNQFDMSSAQGKKKFTDKLAEVVKNIDDPVEQDHYIQLISDISNIDAASFKNKILGLKSSLPQRLKKTAQNTPVSRISQDRVRAIDQLLCLGLMLPGTRIYLEILKDYMLVKPEQIKVFDFLSENPNFDGDMKKLAALGNIGDYVKILVLQFEELYSQVDTLELQYEAARLRAKIIGYFVKEQKSKLSVLITKTDEAKHEQILGKVRDLDKLLKQTKEI